MVLVEQAHMHAGDLDRLTGLGRARHQHRAIKSRRLPGPERVAEAPLQLVEGRLRGNGVERALHDAVQQPHIVQAGDVVGMRVRIKNRIHPLDSARKQLHAHVRRRIDQ